MRYHVHAAGFDGAESTAAVEADSVAAAIATYEATQKAGYEAALEQYDADSHEYEAFMAAWDPNDPDSVEFHAEYVSGERDMPQRPGKPFPPHTVVSAELAE